MNGSQLTASYLVAGVLAIQVPVASEVDAYALPALAPKMGVRRTTAITRFVRRVAAIVHAVAHVLLRDAPLVLAEVPASRANRPVAIARLFVRLVQAVEDAVAGQRERYGVAVGAVINVVALLFGELLVAALAVVGQDVSFLAQALHLLVIGGES